MLICSPVFARRDTGTPAKRDAALVDIDHTGYVLRRAGPVRPQQFPVTTPVLSQAVIQATATVIGQGADTIGRVGTERFNSNPVVTCRGDIHRFEINGSRGREVGIRNRGSRPNQNRAPLNAGQAADVGVYRYLGLRGVSGWGTIVIQIPGDFVDTAFFAYCCELLSVTNVAPGVG